MKQVLIKGLMTYAAFKAATASLFKYNNLKVPPGNFGVPRVSMPQIDQEQVGNLLKWLDGNDVHYDHVTLDAKALRLYQNEINKDKVLAMMAQYQKIATAAIRPVLISSDGFVLDGSHRAVALQNLPGVQRINAIRINLKGLEALNTIRLFAGARYRQVSGKEEKR